MQRRQFFVRAGQFVLAGVAISVYVACGDDDGDPFIPGSSTRIAVSISANHGHSLSLDETDLTPSTPLTLMLSSGAGHTHSLQLSADDVDQLLGGSSVSRTSSNDDGHTHLVTLTP